MNEQEFFRETKKLEEYYEKELNAIQIEAWYEALKKLNLAQYKFLISQAFERFTFMPKLSQMIELKKEILTNVKRTENEVKFEKEKCDKCKNAGVIKYVKTMDGIQYDYYARCICKNSLIFQGLPFIDDVIAKEKNKTYQKLKDKPKFENNQQQDIKKYLSRIGMNVNEK